MQPFSYEIAAPPSPEEQKTRRIESERWKNLWAGEHIRYPYTQFDITGKTIAAVIMIGDANQDPNTVRWLSSPIGIRLIFTDGTAADLQPSYSDSRVHLYKFDPTKQPQGG